MVLVWWWWWWWWCWWCGRYVVIFFVVFNYLYALLGVLLFRRNDPFHFGTLARALLTVYRCETMQSWDVVMWINILGCETCVILLFKIGEETTVILQVSVLITM